MKAIYFWYLILLFPITLCAQNPLRGKVTDTKGAALPGAHLINLRDISSSTTTDVNGDYKLTSLQEGDSIIVQFIGHENQFWIYNEDQYAKNFQLYELQKLLNEIKVSATPLGAEVFAMEKLEPIDIYTNPAAKADPLVAVNTTAASTTKDENAAVSFRGAGPNQTAYFINGVPVRNPIKYTQLNNTGTLSIFNTDFLRSVTVFPGNPPLEYGQSTSGSIILEMADRFPQYQQHSLSLSLANIGYSYRNQTPKKLSVGIFTNYQFNELLQLVNPLGLENINSFRSNDLGLLIAKHTSFGSFKFFQYLLHDNYSFQYQHPSHQDELYQAAYKSITTFNWVYDHEDLNISFTAGNSYNSGHINFGNLDYQEEALSPFMATNVLLDKEDQLTKVGYSFWSNKEQFTGEFPEYSFGLHPDNPAVDISLTAKGDIHEIYAYHRHTFNKTSIGVGSRYGYLVQQEKSTLSYQAQLAHELNDQLQVKLSGGKYYQLSTPQSENEFQLQESYQQALDLEFTGKRIALTQSLYRNSYQTIPIYGTESSMQLMINSKFQLDQSLSILGKEGQIDWFVRSSMDWKIKNGWSLSGIFQSYQGSRYQRVTSTIHHSNINLYEPIYAENFTNFSPYKNLSFSVSKIAQLSDHINSVWFFNINNIADFKNQIEVSYNHDFSQEQPQYLSRRGIYFGVVLNLINEKH